MFPQLWGVWQLGEWCAGWSTIVYMSSGMFRGKESSNRIELSRLVQDLLNFAVLGSLWLWQRGRWVGGIWGHGGVPTCTHMHVHAHTHTHAHVYMCHGFVSAGDALGRECPATPMSSFLAGHSGCKWPNTYLLLGRALLGGANGQRSLLRSTLTLEGGQRTGACITKRMGG